MSREIKFRAWDKISKTMCGVVELKFWNMQEKAYIWRFDEPQTHTWRDLKEVELMQFTGLLDKDGKEIYEGDIVRHYMDVNDIHKGNEPVTTVVSYDKGGFITLKMNDDAYMLWAAVKNFDRYEKGGIEIIGNLYESPNLLK